jgi:hypothetical protein
LLEALKDLSVIHAYATYLHKERGNAATTIARDALRLGTTAWRYACGVDDISLNECAPYRTLRTVMTEIDGAASTTKKDWLQMRHQGHFATVAELKMAVFRVGQLLKAEAAKKKPDAMRLAKLAYKRFMLAMCALKPIARAKDLYLLQLPTGEPERYPVCIVPGESGFSFHANMPKNKKQRVQLQLSPEHCEVVVDYNKYTPILRRGKSHNFAFFDGSGSPVARLKAPGSTRSKDKSALDAHAAPVDDATVDHRASASVMDEKFHNVMKAFLPLGGQKATVTDMRASWTTYYKNKEFNSDVERAALERSMQAIIGHCDATAVASYEKIDPQSVAALAVNVESAHYRTITGTPAPTHVPWTDVKEGGKIVYRVGNETLTGLVVVKYNSKVAEVLPNSIVDQATAHVFIPYTDVMELSDIPAIPKTDAPGEPLPTLEQVATSSSERHRGLMSYGIGAVASWLTTIGFGKFIDKFKECGVDGALLEDLEDQDLIELGIPQQIQRKKLLSEIRKLKV